MLLLSELYREDSKCRFRSCVHGYRAWMGGIRAGQGPKSVPKRAAVGALYFATHPKADIR